MANRDLQLNSPYTAAVTGCGFMLDEFNAALPLLMNENADALLKQDAEEGEHIRISAKASRSRAINEFKRRFNSVLRSFWETYVDLSQSAKRLAYFFVLLKTYRIYFDFQVDAVRKKWNSFSQAITKNDLLSLLSDIACRDEFVDTWSDTTRDRVASSYLAALRKVGFLKDKSDNLQKPDYSNSDYALFVRIGEPWFLDAMLLEPYQIEDIKSTVL